MNFHNPWATPWFDTPNGNPFGAGPGQIPWANPTYKAPLNSVIQTPIYEQDSFGRNFHKAMTQAWNVSVEQQLSNAMAMRVAYVGSQSYHQDYVQDDNFQGYSYCTYYNNPACPLPTQANVNNGTLKLAQFPYSNFTQILEYDSEAKQRATTHCRPPSSDTWPMASRRSPALPGRRPSTCPSFRDIAGETSGMNNPKNLHWSKGLSNAHIPFTWTSNNSYHSPELRGQEPCGPRIGGRLGGKPNPHLAVGHAVQPRPWQQQCCLWRAE